MKLLYTTLLALATLPYCTYAEDTVGAKNTEGYYMAHLPYTESFDNFGGNYDATSLLRINKTA